MEQIYFLVQELNCISPRKKAFQKKVVSLLDGQWFSLFGRKLTFSPPKRHLFRCQPRSMKKHLVFVVRENEDSESADLFVWSPPRQIRSDHLQEISI